MPMRVVGSRVVYENRWMRVHEDRTERADGTPGMYGWVEKPPAALIVPVEDGFVWLVEQYRHPVGERFWEFRRVRPTSRARSSRGRSSPRRRACARARWSC